MKKRMLIMLICVGILFGGIFAYKIFVGFVIKRFIANQSHVVTVSTMKVGSSPWQSTLQSTGTVRAIRGVNVTTELAGMVETISFIPGSFVKEGTVLVQQNADTQIGQLHADQAQAALALTTYNRDKAQYAVHAVSKEQLDTDLGNLNSANANVESAAATVAKLTVKAPFTGRLGICDVNPGQFLNPGDTVTSLQTFDPIYVDFFMAQQVLGDVKINQPVNITADSFSGKNFTGKITTIQPVVEVNTRNVELEATIANPDALLTPGMFVNVVVTVDKPGNYITVPQAAITFNPYGNIVYKVEQKGKDDKGKPILIANQAFVITGDTRGDQIIVLKGLNDSDTIVTSGQLKLKNGDKVVINNSVQPSDSPNPYTPDEH